MIYLKMYIEQVSSQNPSETGGLGVMLKIKSNARVMLTVNIGRDDRLVNGQLCTIKHILKGGNGNVTKLYIEFDDSRAGLKIISKGRCGSEH